MFLVIDTETNGKPINYRAPVERLDNWPRVVQLAWLLFDAKGEQVTAESFIVKPDGWKIPDDAARIHGITTERAMEVGREIGMVLGKLRESLDFTQIIVAHNLDFDLPITGAEFLRIEKENPLGRLHGFCTMKAGTDLCKLPGPYGFKWPRLAELHSHLFGAPPEELHEALADARSCAKCFFEMRRRENAAAPVEANVEELHAKY